MKFINQLATYIKEKEFDLRALTIVLPSERATKYLVEALLSVYGKPIFSPEITTIDRWVKKHSLPIIDNTRLLIALFQIHFFVFWGRRIAYQLTLFAIPNHGSIACCYRRNSLKSNPTAP